MDKRLIDRIFEDIDKNTERSENLSMRIGELSILVYSHATSLGIVTKLVIAIIIFLIISSLTIIIKETQDTPVIDHTPNVYHQIPYDREYQNNIKGDTK